MFYFRPLRRYVPRSFAYQATGEYINPRLTANSLLTRSSLASGLVALNCRVDRHLVPVLRTEHAGTVARLDEREVVLAPTASSATGHGGHAVITALGSAGEASLSGSVATGSIDVGQLSSP